MSALLIASAAEIQNLKAKITQLVEDYHNETDYNRKRVIGSRIDCHKSVLQEWELERQWKMEDDGDLMAYRSEDVI